MGKDYQQLLYYYLTNQQLKKKTTKPKTRKTSYDALTESSIDHMLPFDDRGPKMSD
jgi:ribosomal protein L13